MNTTQVKEVTKVKINPIMKDHMLKLMTGLVDSQDEEGLEFVTKFIDSCMALEVERPKRATKAKAPKEEGPKYSKVSAYSMFRKSKDNGDWKTMTDEEKAVYQVMADEENAARKTKAIERAESGESDPEKSERRTSGYHLYLKQRGKDDAKWSDLDEDTKNHWNTQAVEANKDIVVEKKPKKEDIVYDSYGIAVRYLRKKSPESKFYPWKTLPLESKQLWNNFVMDSLSKDMNKALMRELIVASADKLESELLVHEN